MQMKKKGGAGDDYFLVSTFCKIITVGLATIWFAGGSMVALIVAAVGGPIWLQVILFFVVSFVLLFFTRPWAVKYLNPHKTRTNYEDAIGKTVRVTAKIDNIAETGTAVLNGQEWTARSNDEAVTIDADTTADVVAVRNSLWLILFVKAARQKFRACKKIYVRWQLSGI